MTRDKFGRRDVLKMMAVGGGLAALAPMLNLPLDVQAQGKKRKVIFVVHDLNPFFVPAIVGMKNFGALAGWDTQFIGPPTPDRQKTVELQYNAIASKPDAVAFTAIDSEAFLDPIKEAQDEGIFVVCSTREPRVSKRRPALPTWDRTSSPPETWLVTR